MTYLETQLKAGDTIYIVCTHVASNGMSRHLKALIIDNEGELKNISFEIAEALGWKMAKNTDAVLVQGCGMDMGSHLVYTLSRKLLDDGYALKTQWI